MVSAIVVCRGDGVLRTEMLALLSVHARSAFLNRVCLLLAVIAVWWCCGFTGALQRQLCDELDSRKVCIIDSDGFLRSAKEPCFALWDSSHVSHL